MAKPKDKEPWFKFFPANWRGNPELRLCSIGARGLWMEMICVMHEAEPYGHLINNGLPVTNRQLTALAGISLTETMRFIAEMESAGVYSRTPEGTIYSRKMVRDKAKTEKFRNYGYEGGNPTLTGEDKPRVNPTDKAKDKPRSKKQSSIFNNPESAAARELDENGLKQESVLKALFVSTRSSLGWSIPNLDQIRIWLSDGIPQGIISSAVTPMLKRKEDMASLSYCDSAVREAHAVVSHLQIVPKNVWVDEGTQEWSCHQAESYRLTGGGTMVTDQKDEAGRLTGRRGWYFKSRWPEGFNDFGERVETSPQSEEDAA